jgi:hypothetical protein
MSDECQCRCGKAGCISEEYTEEGKQKRIAARWKALGLLDQEAERARRWKLVEDAMRMRPGDHE